MLDPKKLLNRKIISNSKVASNASTNEFSRNSPNASLLIHDEGNEYFFEDGCNDKEFVDKDIPAEKRSIINDPTYFKQLSLSFYGSSPQLPQRVLQTQEDDKKIVVTKPQKMYPGSLSPGSNSQYFYVLKSPSSKNGTDMPQLNFTNFSLLAQQSQLCLSDSRGDLGLKKEQQNEKNPLKHDFYIRPLDTKNFKPLKISINQSNSNVSTTRFTTQRHLQLATDKTISSATTPRSSDSLFKTGAVTARMLSRPSVAKLMGITQQEEYYKSEPNTSTYPKSPSRPKIVPDKLKMFSQNNFSRTSFKSIVDTESDKDIKKINSKEKLKPTRPSFSKVTKEAVTKRFIVANGEKGIKKNMHFE
jgi:hypothetical protein